MPKKIMDLSENCLDDNIEYGAEFHYQKFRYKTEKRTGKKQHTKPMMIIKGLPNNSQNLQVYIFCVSPHKPHLLHPNELVGKDCCKGVYHTTDVSKITKDTDGGCCLECPFLYICRTKKNAVKNSVKEMLNYLPPSAKEMGTMDDNGKTDSLRLKIMMEIDGIKFEKLTSIITHHDSGEKVKLNIFELTRNVFEDQCEILILTEDTIGPDIKPGEFEVWTKTDNWQSKPYKLQKADIYYKRAIKYVVPKCQDSCIESQDVKGKIVLRCIINHLTCECDIVFTQSKLNRKRKILHEKRNDFKRPCLERDLSPTEISQGSDIPVRSMTLISDGETSTIDPSYRLIMNICGKDFDQVSEQSTSKPAQQNPDLDIVPQKEYVQQQPTSERVQQQPTSERVQQQPTSERVQQQPTSERVQQQPTSERVQQQPTSKYVQQQPTSERVQQQPTSKYVQQQPTSERVQQQPTSKYVQQQPTSKYVQQQSESVQPNVAMEYDQQAVSTKTFSQSPRGKDLVIGNGVEQEMESDSSHLYLPHGNYTLVNNSSQPSSSALAELDGHAVHAGSSLGKSLQNDSGFGELNQVISIGSSSYQPQIEPITPVSSYDIIARSAELSEIPINSRQDINNVGEKSILEEVHQESNNMNKSGSPPGTSMNLFQDMDFNAISNMDSINLYDSCKDLFAVTNSDDPKG